MDGFAYSGALKELGDSKWTEKNLDKYIKSPADYAPGIYIPFLIYLHIYLINIYTKYIEFIKIKSI